jgi:16S rRNA (cytidine1402-2'-O)-methyltransferase
MSGKLFLIPNKINEDYTQAHIPPYVINAVKEMRVFFVEDPKSARKLLKIMDPGFPLQECTFYDLNEHSKWTDLKREYDQLINNNVGIISEAGLPCVADPGSELVFYAQQKGVEVIPLIGPSSIFLALMASGLSGQNFAFHGYLPKDQKSRIEKIKLLEKRAQLEVQTQIFMETPYRNNDLLEDILKNCRLETWVCVASHVGASHQSIQTLSVAQWQEKKVSLPKEPSLFLLACLK